MQASAEESDPNVFPLRTVLVLLVGSIGASYWLVPRQDQLVERLFLDKQYHRMAEAIKGGMSDASSFKPSDMRAMTPEQLTTLSHLLRLTPREQLSFIFAGPRPTRYDPFVHGLVLGAVRYVDVITPRDGWAMIQPQIGKLTPAQQIEVARLLAANAHALNQPTLAAAILHSVAQLPESGWDVGREMVLAYRWSGQTQTGVRELKKWIVQKRESLPTDVVAEGASIGIEMAVESGDPSLALDFALDGLALLGGDKIIPDSQMKAAHDLALQCGRTHELLPWLRRFVAALPQSQVDWRELLKSGIRETDSFEGGKKWTQLLAQTCDWNSEFDTAYDHHLRLAAMGRIESLDRCLALSGFLGRDEETAELLERLRPFNERLGAQIFLARTLAGLGRDVDSKPLFEAWLETHPDDAEARFDYACLIEDMGDESGAMVAFEELVRRDPKSVLGVKKLAEAYTRERRFADALRLYEGLPGTEHDVQTLENYAMLAESLGDYEQIVRALELAVAAEHKVSVSIFENLAEAASHLADPQKQLSVLTSGLQQFPDSVLLRISLADAFASIGDTERAIATLTEKPALGSNLEAVSLILSLAKNARSPELVMAFLGRDVEKRLPLPSAGLLDLAVLCRICGEVAKSERVFASVIEDAENAVLIAEARFDVGDYETAERLMNAHMARRPRAIATEWVFFGEIYEALGKADEAKRAFDYSLALMTADLPGTAYNLPVQSTVASPTP